MFVYHIFVFGKEIGFTFNYSTAYMKEKELRGMVGDENIEIKEEEYEPHHY
jgi:hypothetical protein